jgi:hypothetical protein
MLGALIAGFFLGAVCLASVAALVLILGFRTDSAASLPASAPKPVDLSLTMSERFLNNRVQEELKRNPLPVQDVRLDVKPANRIEIQFSVSVPIVGVQRLRLPVQLGSKDGQVTVRAIETPVGNLNLGLPIADIIAQQINDRVRRAGEAIKFSVVDLQTDKETLTISLHAEE